MQPPKRELQSKENLGSPSSHGSASSQGSPRSLEALAVTWTAKSAPACRSCTRSLHAIGLPWQVAIGDELVALVYANTPEIEVLCTDCVFAQNKAGGGYKRIAGHGGELSLLALKPQACLGSQGTARSFRSPYSSKYRTDISSQGSASSQSTFKPTRFVMGVMEDEQIFFTKLDLQLSTRPCLVRLRSLLVCSCLT